MFINGHIIRETPKAILVLQSRGNTDGGNMEVWLPKSQTEGFKFNRNNQPEIYIIVPEWLVNKNGLDANEEDHPMFGLPAETEQMEQLW